MDEKELIVKSEEKEDFISKTKTIYNAGFGEIFWKNFLAGISRSLGGIFVYIVFLFIFSGIFLNIILPKIMPSIESYTNLIKSFGTINNPKQGTGIVLPQNFDLQKILGQ